MARFSEDIANWLRSAEQRLASLEVVGLKCGQTMLTFRVSDLEILRFVARMLTPLLYPLSVPIEDHECPALSFHHLYSDALVQEITQCFIEHNERHVDKDVGYSGGYRYAYGVGNTMILDPREGVAIHLNLQDRQFHFVHSSRTRWPTIQFGDLVYEPLLRSAQRHGGVVFHAGAVATDEGAILVVGYGGDGKSTLISGLMRAGAAYVANERTIVKQMPAGFNAYSFCDWVHVGLGTAMQDPALANLLPFPDNISLPQRRFSYGALDHHSRDQWPALSDKMGLLCDEFSSLLEAPPARSGVPIVGIIRPKVSFEPITAVVTPMAKADVRQLLDDNASDRSHYPDWMRWSVTEANLDMDALASLPALCVEFHLASGRLPGLDDPLAKIFAALQEGRPGS